jgi:hypothetical protein
MYGKRQLGHLKTSAALFTLFVSSTRLVYADDDGKLDNPLTVDTLSEFLSQILDVVVIIGTPIVVFFIIYAGFLFVTARGNEEQLSKAKQTIIWVIVGAALVLGAQALSVAIKETVESISTQQQETHEMQVASV